MTGGLGSSCGACKFLRRRCTSECVFAPYFCYDQAPNHFSAVHKVFGASNVSKLLLHLPVHNRSEAAITISYEALARMRDPIYGCVAHIFALQQQVASLQQEIDLLGNQMANTTAFDVPNYGCSQEINYPNNNGYQISSQMDIENYLSQQTPFISQAETLEVNQAFYSQTNVQWEEETPHFYNDPNVSETLFEGMDQDIFMHFAWMGNGSSTINL